MESRQEGLRSPGSILDGIGRKGLYGVVWRATPLPWRLISSPCGIIVQRGLLVAGNSLPKLPLG
jgi:hypothetical protein